MTKEKEKLNEMVFESKFLTAIFFVCSVMVVGIHCFYVPAEKFDTITAYIQSFLCHGVFIAAVPIFFFLSGHLFFRNIESSSDIYKKMKTRAKSVVMPFIAWSALYFIVFSVASYTPFFSAEGVSFHPFDIIKGIIFYKYSFPLWYMYQLVMFIILTPVIHKLIKNKYVGLGILIVLAVVSIFVKDSIEVNVFEDASRSLFQFGFFCYFFCGCLSVRFSKELLKAKACVLKKRKTVALISAVFLVCFAFLQSVLFEERIHFFYERILVPVVAVCLYLFIQYMKKSPSLRKPLLWLCMGFILLSEY